MANSCGIQLTLHPAMSQEHGNSYSLMTTFSCFPDPVVCVKLMNRFPMSASVFLVYLCVGI